MTLSPADRRAVLRVLKRARALVKKGWTQGPAAKDASGDWVEPESESARSWCALGAVSRATPRDGGEHSMVIRALGFIDWFKLVDWNETYGRTQAQVLARFDKAITRLEAHA